MLKYNKDLVKYARELRKNITDEEKELWYKFLKRLPVTVNRQKNIGNFIVDFYISSKNAVIEIDGAQHRMPQNKISDEIRDAELFNLGIKVLRYSNEDINKRFNIVCDDILKNIGLTIKDLKDQSKK